MKYELVVKPLEKERHWEVVKGFGYAGMYVEEGFTFDGCSIPWCLRWRFKHGGAKFAAGGMHDFLYRYAGCSKERADKIFLELMLANGVSEHDARMMYLGVKYGGQASWNKHRKEQAIREK